MIDFNRVEGVKTILEKTGLSLKEAVNLYLIYNADVDKAIAGALEQHESKANFVSPLTTVATTYRIRSRMFPDMNTYLDDCPTEEHIQWLKLRDPQVEIEALCSLYDANEALRRWYLAQTPTVEETPR
jgi:hypothetical protein